MPRKIAVLRVGPWFAKCAGMTVDRSAGSLGSKTQGAIQETAQALVKAGELVAAVELLDRYLSQFDGDWGVWLYFAGLCARLGKMDSAVAAYRACARQLEADGHLDRAREALASAIRLVPRDAGLKRELEQVGLMPAVQHLPLPGGGEGRGEGKTASKKLPDPAIHLTAVIPGRAKKRPPPPPVDVTDPYFAIFDIIDAERTQS